MDELIIVGTLVGIPAFLGGVVWLVIWSKRRNARAAAEVAAALKLAPGPLSDLKEGWKADATYAGTLNGVPVRLSVGQKLAQAGGTDTLLLGVIVEAFYPQPFEFEFQLLRGAGGLGALQHSDKAFNEQCATISSDPRTLALLENPTLRIAIAAFLREGRGSAYIDSSGVGAAVLDAQWGGAAVVQARLQQAAAIARNLHAARK